jgi:hypothetical protein
VANDIIIPQQWNSEIGAYQDYNRTKEQWVPGTVYPAGSTFSPTIKKQIKDAFKKATTSSTGGLSPSQYVVPTKYDEKTGSYVVATELIKKTPTQTVTPPPAQPTYAKGGTPGYVSGEFPYVYTGQDQSLSPSQVAYAKYGKMTIEQFKNEVFPEVVKMQRSGELNNFIKSLSLGGFYGAEKKINFIADDKFYNAFKSAYSEAAYNVNPQLRDRTITDYVKVRAGIIPGGTGAGSGNLLSSISKAISLTDLNDAKLMIDNAYKVNLGRPATPQELDGFVNRYRNFEKSQFTITKTYEDGTTITEGGLSAAEKASFLQQEIAKKIDITKERAGMVDSLADELEAAAKLNGGKKLSNSELQNGIISILSESDATLQNQKKKEIIQGYRDNAAKIYLGVADDLKAGKDLDNYTNRYKYAMNQILGRNPEAISNDDPLLVSALNVKDGSNYRIANDNEFIKLLYGTEEWKKSADAQSKYRDLTSAFSNKLQLGQRRTVNG